MRIRNRHDHLRGDPRRNGIRKHLLLVLCRSDFRVERGRSDHRRRQPTHPVGDTVKTLLAFILSVCVVLAVGGQSAPSSSSAALRTAYAQKTAVAAWKRHFLAAHPSARWPSGALAPTNVQANPSVKGNIFVAPNGSDSGSDCQRFSVKQVFPTTRSNVCLTIGKAYDIASPGDKIVVGNGTYSSNQYICRGTSWPSCGTSGDHVGPVITIQAETRHGALIVGTFILGSLNGSASAPSYVTIDGIDVNGALITRQENSGVVTRQVTFQNMHIWNLANTSLNYLVMWMSGLVVGLTYNNMDVGPALLQHRPDRPISGPIAYTVPVNVTYQNSQIHDAYDGCEDIPANVTAAWGACTGTNTGAHVDGFQLWGGFRNLKFLNNRFYNFCMPGTSACNGALFAKCGDPTNGSALYECKNLTIDHNVMIESVPGGPTPNTLSSAPMRATLPFSAWTEQSGLRTIRSSAAVTLAASTIALGQPGGKNGFKPTATVYVANNLASSWYYYSGGQCVGYRMDGSTFQPTFVHNQFNNYVCDPT